jgi:aspartate/methionine/tyrosine aminotransferase
MHAPTPFTFMHWAKTWVGRLPYCLGASGVPAPSPEEFPPVVSAYAGANYYGTSGLREAIATAYGAGIDSVLVSAGTSLANYTALTVLAGAGDRILVEAPTYPILEEIPRYHGARVERLPRRPEEGWRPSLAEIRRRSGQGDRVAAIVLTRLHNPSGVDLDAAYLAELADLAEERDFLVLLDEVFLDFLPDAVPGHRFSPRFLTTASLTKVYGFGALRVGWILAEPEILRPMKEFSFYLAVDGALPSQATAVRVLENRARFRERACALAEAGRRCVDEWVAAREDVSWTLPAGGISGFVRFHGRSETARFAARLREKYEVNIAEGEFFGMPGWARLSFGLPREKLIEALDRIGRALDEPDAHAAES